METGNHITGTCLCGAVTVKANPDKNIFGACRCGMIAKFGGT
ncbi:hypothetical protein ACNQKP_13810 [Bdellovibrio bacteriovorus]